MTVVMVVYALTLFFRPVLYRLRVAPLEHAAAVEIVREHGRSSLDVFKLWPDKSYFFGPLKRAFLAYSVGGGFALVLGDPVGPEDAIEPTVRSFGQMCTENGWGFAFYQTLPDFLPTYAHCDLSRLKLGEDAIPNAPANVGTYQFFCVLALTLFGVDKTIATGFSVVVFVALTLPLWLLGSVALGQSGATLAAVRAQMHANKSG